MCSIEILKIIAFHSISFPLSSIFYHLENRSLTLLQQKNWK